MTSRPTSPLAGLISLRHLPGPVPATARNTYAISWMLLLVVVPLLVVFWATVPVMRQLVIVIGGVLVVIAITQIILIRIGRDASAVPMMLIAGWSMLTWAAWLTGGLYSPSLYAQFVFVVLAEMCNGWRWGLATLGFSLSTIGFFAWAQQAGIVPPSIIASSLYLYAAIVCIYLVALFMLEAMLSNGMRRAQDRLGTELTERRAIARQLRDVIDNAPFGAFIGEVDDGSICITQTNRSAGQILNRNAEEFVNCRAEEIFPRLKGSELLTEIHRVAEAGGTYDLHDLVATIRDENRILDVHAFQISDCRAVVFFSDVTEQRRFEREMEFAAFHDELTNLPNRKLLLDRLTMALASAERREAEVAVLFIDMDNFKPINDEFGHPFGDKLLRSVARRLQESARASDTVARFGGDEFTVVLPDVADAEQVGAIAQKLVYAFREPFSIEGRELVVTLSIGVAITTPLDREMGSLLEHADMAMYQMKRAGRDGFQIYEPRRPAALHQAL
ncbi:MAG: diguanylate cyclase [Coriobacteriia bacterium]|nr:diguanylate cyclase [Coriobacteriia bacterium]